MHKALTQLLWLCDDVQVVPIGKLMTTVAARHGRLLLELLDILVTAGYITLEAGPPRAHISTAQLSSTDVKAALGQLASQKALLENKLVPDLAASVRLVWECARALPDILTGGVSCSSLHLSFCLPTRYCNLRSERLPCMQAA